MKILQVITRMDSIGGAQRHVVELCHSAVSAGHDVHLAYGGQCALPASELEGIHLHPVDALVRPIAPWKDTLTLFQLRKIIKQVSPDLIATHSTKAGLLGRIAAWITGTADVHTVHGWSVSLSGHALKRFLYSQIEGKGHRLADGIICVSQHDQRHAKELGLDPAKTRLIYNGRPDAPTRALGNETDDPHPLRIVSVGRLAWPKQPDQLLRFLVSNPEVCLDLVGDGPQEDKVKAQAIELGVSDRVIFHGHVGNIYPVLQQGDIFALVSDWEGFPMSTLEAMSAGLLTVVSDVGGAGEAIIDGVTGFTIPRGDEKTLHERLSILIDDKEKRASMGHEAQLLFSEKFRLETMVAQTLAYYSDILQGK